MMNCSNILYSLILIVSDTSENSSALYVVNVERNGKVIYTWKVSLSWNLIKIENKAVFVSMPNPVLVV